MKIESQSRFITTLSRCLALSLSSLVLAGTSGITQAADTKTYPGHMCHYKTSTAGISYSSSGWVVNQSSSKNVKIVCPIVRDEMFHTGLEDVQIYVTNSGAGALQCSVHNRSQNGSSGTLQTKSTNDLEATLNYDPMVDFSWGNYTIDCTLPRKTGGNKSRIRSYIVHEAL